MGTRVKICGITNLTDARRAVALGADYLGFNFYQGSPRFIKPEVARRIIRRLPRRVKAIGVFVDSTAAEIERVAKRVRLHGVQLHGREPAKVVERVSRFVPVWKALRVRTTFRPEILRRYAAAEAILLDAFHPGAKGGTGKTFDWRAATRAKRLARIVLAGGLKPENVAAAIRSVRPAAVDVASGVERSPGKKDAAKMRAFIQAVRRAK